MGRRLGDPDDPLLVSVRSGAKFSMPGMMETVLNVGLNDESVRGLAEQSHDERFAMDSYRRLLQMFGATVLGIESEVFAAGPRPAEEGPRHRLRHRPRRRRPARAGRDLQAGDPEHAGRDFPQDPREQLDLAMRAVFDSWNTERAVLYRRQERIAEGLGTAVNVQAMVFGNRGDDSGSGVAFTRDPASGNQGVYGDYLQNAQGEDVVAGIRNTVSLADMDEDRPEVARRAARDHGDAREALPRHVRHRVHRRARQALDAPDPRRQAHPGGGVPDRPAHDRRGPDRRRRGDCAG